MRCAPKSLPWKSSARSPSAPGAGLAVVLAFLGVVCCAPPPRLDRAPDAEELQRLSAIMRTPPRFGWSARGHARAASRDGRVEGALLAAVDLPARLRVELRARALFGLLGERLVLSLPGDGHLLLYRARTDRLERVPFVDSEVARLLPTGAPEELHALLTGCPPWPLGKTPADLAARVRLVRRSDDGEALEFRVQLPETGAVFELRLRGAGLEFSAWEASGGGRVEIRYDRWMELKDWRQPGRLRLRAPREGLEGEIRLEQVEGRSGFGPADFEVY